MVLQELATEERLLVGSSRRAAHGAGIPWLLGGKRRWWRDSVLRRMLVIADAAVFGLALLTVGLSTAPLAGLEWSLLALPGWILLAKLHGLYDRDHQALRHLTVDELTSIVLWAATATGVLALVVEITPASDLRLGAAFRVWAVVVVAALALRGYTRLLWRRFTPPERILILGAGSLADSTRHKLELFPDIHGFVADQVDNLTIPDLVEWLDRLTAIDRIVVATQALNEELIATLVPLCRATQTKLTVAPPLRGLLGTAVRLEHVADVSFIEYNTWDVSRSTLLLKRGMDVAIGAVALVLAAPLFACIALAVYLDCGRPIIFAQRRAGAHGKPFRIYKFRTMDKDAEEQLRDFLPFDELPEPMFKLPRDPRVTRVGRFLRRTSLDELPQLWNVVKGEMSLVGPRPEQMDLVERYEPEHRVALAVKPGITGPMQVFGRGKLTFEERLAVERDYIENISVARDLRIIALTVSAVVTGKGAF